MSKFFVYTDGACKNNPGKGAYAFIVYDEFDEVWAEGSGFFEKTTNNRMELLGIISALKMMRGNQGEYNVFTDSSYVANAFNDGWIEKWKDNGWKTTERKDVLNRDLWEELILESKNVYSFSIEKIHQNQERIQMVHSRARKVIFDNSK